MEMCDSLTYKAGLSTYKLASRITVKKIYILLNIYQMFSFCFRLSINNL